MNGINFHWNIDEHLFQKAKKGSRGFFGRLGFGKFKILFFGERCELTAIVSIWDGEVFHYIPIEEFCVPKRRTLASFKRRMEAIIYEKLGAGDSEINDEDAYALGGENNEVV